MRKAELIALLALCFFLPLYEAPKGIAWAAYVVLWLANRVRARDWGGPWDRWDLALALWVGCGFLAAGFSGLHGSEWHGAFDPLRCGAVLWMLKRSRYTREELQPVFHVTIASAVLALAIAEWRLLTGAKVQLELNSVGHINHSAIYLAIVFGACVAWAYVSRRVVPALLAAVLLVTLVSTASRAAVLAAGAILLALGAASLRRSRVPLAVSAALVCVTAGAIWLGGAEVMQKHQANVESHNVLSFRGGIWRAALVAWQRYPVLGIGADNFHLITLERLEQWNREAGTEFDAERYSIFPHAHSLYFTALAERGAIGLAALAALLVVWLVELVRLRPTAATEDEVCIYWGAAASAWLVTAMVGLVNTTLHHEHGILAMLFVGLWLARTRASSARSSAPS